MAASLFLRGSLWTFRVKVRTCKGVEYASPHALWETKNEAERDVDLFIWFKGRKGPADPHIPSPHGQWFKTMKPGSSWDEIREFVSTRGCKGFSLKRKQPASFDVAKRRRVEAKADLEASEAEITDDIVPEAQTALDSKDMIKNLVQGRVMKKAYSQLGDRRRAAVDTSILAALTKCWKHLAPGQPIDQLRSCVTSIFGGKVMNDAMKSSIQTSYRLAKEKKDNEFMVQFLSTFMIQKDITRAKLEEMMDQTISARKYQHARHHAVIYGAGQPAEVIVHQRNIAKRQAIIDRFVAYCLDKGVITANGRTVLIPGKEGIPVPNVKRLEGKQPLIKAFEEDERRLRGLAIVREDRNQKREYVSLRRQDMEEVIAVVCPEIHTSKAALDVVGQLHGTNNFKILKKKLVQLEGISPTLIDEILNVRASMSAAEEALSHKDQFRSNEHFGCEFDSHGPAVHCHYFAFGRVDPVEAVPVENVEKMACGHYHIGTCEVCCEIERFAILLTDLAEKIGVGGDERAKMLNFAYHKNRFIHYAGHQARLLHESKVTDIIKGMMREDHSLIHITADYAMKFLPLKDSEAQSDFFGKAGINWHGLCLLWFSPEDGQFLQYYVNQCVEDSTEDGISVVALLQKVSAETMRDLLYNHAPDDKSIISILGNS
jgi:hypothetical protein